MRNTRETGGESPEERLHAAAEAGIEYAFAYIGEAYEGEGEDALEHHIRQHTIDIIPRAVRILEAMREGEEKISDHQIELVRVASGFHDMIQDWVLVEERVDGKAALFRQRMGEHNEQQSANKLEAFVKDVNEKSESPVFSEDDISQMKEAIMTTVADFDGRTVVQKNLSNESGVIARAVALADLGEAGMEGFDAHLRSGDAIFREEQLDITRKIRSGEEIPEELQGAFQERMLNWSEGQVVFAEGRRDHFEVELGELSEGAKAQVRTLFSKFDDTIDRGRKHLAKRKEMSFTELAKDMGYAI